MQGLGRRVRTKRHHERIEGACTEKLEIGKAIARIHKLAAGPMQDCSDHPEKAGLPENCSELSLEAALEATGEVRRALVGDSMGRGWADVVCIRPVPRGRRIPIGCVAVYRRGERLYAHRVLARWGNRYIVKGDARLAWDRPLPRAEDFIGIVVHRRPADIAVRCDKFRAAVELLKALTAWPFLPLLRRFPGRRGRPGGGGQSRNERTAHSP